MYSYYTIYSFDNSSIGFNGPYVDFGAPVVEAPTGGSAILIIVLVIMALTIIGFAIFFVMRQRSKKLENNLTSSNSTETGLN